MTLIAILFALMLDPIRVGLSAVGYWFFAAAKVRTSGVQPNLPRLLLIAVAVTAVVLVILSGLSSRPLTVPLIIIHLIATFVWLGIFTLVSVLRRR